MGRRIRWLGLVLVLCFTLVVLQLVNIQFRQASGLDSSQYNPRNTPARLDNRRGLILAATGTILAQSKRVPDVPTGTYQYYRTYPTGTLFSGIVGYSSIYRGTAGVEYEYNKDLVPHAQPERTLGQLLSPPAPTPDDVTLTVRQTLQRAARTALGDKDGAVVVLQPKSGDVLAMYSNPSFDPNTLASPDEATYAAASKADFATKDAEGFYPGDPMATYDRFLPGSTFKVVTSAAAYNLKPTLAGFTWGPGGCTTPGALPTTLQICNDADTDNGAKSCGGTMVQMLPESCDPGYAELGLHLGPTTLSEQAELFGYNATPPIDLTQGDVAQNIVTTSHFPAPGDLVPGQYPGPGGVPLAAFGQGTVQTTALQNAMVAEGIADTGVVMTPHVMAQVEDSQGNLVQSYAPTVYKQAVSAAAAQQVNQLMQGVAATPAGTAYGIFPAGDDVAVKTGTAQITTPTKKTEDWMIGFAPARDPTVAVAVVVPEQPTNTTGAGVAGPIFRAVIEATLAEQAREAQQPTTTTTSLPTTPTTTPRTDHHHPPPTTTAPTTTTAPPTTTPTTTVPPTTAFPTTTVPPTTTPTTTPTTPPPATGVTPIAATGAAAGGGATTTAPGG